MKFLKHIASFATAGTVLAMFAGCGNDSSTSPEAGQSGERGAFRVARPAVFATKGGINYFTYYWGTCTITNGVYSWNPNGSDDINAYTISNDTAKVFYRDSYDYLNDKPIEDNDLDYQMYGKNSSIFGNWDIEDCVTIDGEKNCNLSLFNNTLEIKQDSVITYMTLNPNYNMVNDAVHDIFHEYFNLCIYNYQKDDSSYFVDVPERGISFSNQDNNNVTVTVQGQVVNVHASGYTETKAVHYIISISSNGTTCSSETRFGYVNKAEYCSDAYKDYLTDDGDNEKDSGTISTHYLRDKANEAEFTSCLHALFQDNPAYKPEKE